MPYFFFTFQKTMIRYSVLIAFFLPCLNMAQDMNQLRGEKFSHELQRMDLYGIGAPDLQVKSQIQWFKASTYPFYPRYRC